MLKYIKNLLLTFNSSKRQKNKNQLDIDFKINQCSNGWVKIDINEILNNANMMLVFNEIKQTEHLWIDSLTRDWFRAIKYYSKGALLEYSTRLRDHQIRDLNKVKILYDNKLVIQEETGTVISSKRILTISSILFNFSIPKGLLVIDKKMFSDLMAYMVITETHNLSVDHIHLGDYRNFNKDTATLMPNLTDSVKQLTSNPIFLNRIDTLDTLSRYPNFYELRQLMTSHTETDLNDLDDLQVRKVITCLFMYNELPIPRDYVHVDIQVIDWVKNSGIYEKAANWKSKSEKVK